MSLRNVTLTAVAALSLGMAAKAQTTTITVPMSEPGTAAPAPTGPGTTVTVTDGQQRVETTGGAPAVTVEPAATPAADAPAAASTAPAADATTTTATPETPAPAAPMAESAADAETGTAAQGMDVTTPTPTDTAGEPPAAPQQGLPDSATEAQVEAPVPATGDPAPAATDPAPAATEPAATAVEAPAEAPEGEAPMQPADGATAPDATAVPADAAPAEEPPAAVSDETAPAADPATADAGAGTEPDADAAHAPGEEGAADAHATHQEIRDVAFSFEGPFGAFDQFQLQRGLQVYTEVCAGCHGMKFVPLRTLGDAGGPGLPEDQVRAYAAAMSIDDAETGEERPRVPTDMFPTVTGDGMGPDLSLMAKARAGFHGPYGTGLSQLFNGIGGPEYIYSILTGYTGEEKEQAGTILYENTAFPGGWISMAPPLSDDQVTFEDGSPSDLHSASKDVAAFLMWTAEPKMMARKKAGLVSVLFLIVLSALLYLTNKRIWWPIKHREDVIGDGR